MDSQKVEPVFCKVEDPRDHALFWLIYDGGHRCQEALVIEIDDIPRSKRSISIHSKDERPREKNISRVVGTLPTREYATSGPLFVTHRKTRLPRRADLENEGYAALSYWQANTLWKGYTPDWGLHQLHHTANNLHTTQDYTEADLNALADIPPCATWNATSPITAKRPNAKHVGGSVASARCNNSH